MLGSILSGIGLVILIAIVVVAVVIGLVVRAFRGGRSGSDTGAARRL